MGDGDDGKRRGGGVVLLLAAAATFDVIDLAKRVLARADTQGSARFAIEVIPDGESLRRRLAEAATLPRVVVVDPAWAMSAPDEARRLCQTVAFARRPVRLLLWGAPTPASMHGVAFFARWVPCKLAVRGVEDERLWEIVNEGRCGPPTTAVVGEEQLLLVIDRMPARIRNAWGWVLQVPEQATVKGVAFRAGLTRRSLERWHRSLRAPTPGRLLRHLVTMIEAT